MLKRSLSTNGLVLALFALITTGLITIVNSWTAPVIKQQQLLQKQRSLQQVLSPDVYDNDLALNCLTLSEPSVFGYDSTRAYRGYNKQQPSGIVFETRAPDGYSGGINMLVGVYATGTVSGVRVLDHKETPGLGDKIDLRIDDWILSFNDTSLQDDTPYAVKKDGGNFDQFTGATITPRATVNAVARVLAYYRDNNSQLWSQPIQCEQE